MRSIGFLLGFMVSYFLLVIPVVQAGLSGPLVLSTTCSLFQNGSSVFADAQAGSGGSGTYLDPYGSLAEVSDRLESDANVDTVCLTGTFTESFQLSYAIQSSTLSIFSYWGGAIIDASGSSYAISTAYFSGLQELTIHGLSLQGFSYAGLSINYLDKLEAENLNIDASSASYGISLLNIDEVELENITIAHSSYAAISGNNVEKFSLAKSSLSGVGNYAVILNGADEATLQTSTFSGYHYTGLDLEAQTVKLHRNTLIGQNYFHGVQIDGATYALITNNFILDHSVSGVDIGEAQGAVYLLNNSFSNNKVAAKLNGGGPHALLIFSYNNIFYSNDSQSAYDDNGFDPTPPTEAEINTLMETSPSLSDNPDLTLISDYNLFYGAVAVSDGSPVTFAQWQGGGYDAHSISGNPSFVSTSNLHITNNSPAVDKGMDLSLWLSKDIDGQTRGTLFDIGADEIFKGRLISIKKPNSSLGATTIGYNGLGDFSYPR